MDHRRIVVGVDFSRGFRRLDLGSGAAATVRRSPVSTLVVPVHRGEG